jgi:hypothetical protein
MVFAALIMPCYIRPGRYVRPGFFAEILKVIGAVNSFSGSEMLLFA